MKYGFIQAQEGYPVNMLCAMLKVTTSAYYAWRKRPAKLITADELHLYRRAKELFKKSRNSLGSRELAKNLNEEKFAIGRYKTRSIMRKLRLIVK